MGIYRVWFFQTQLYCLNSTQVATVVYLGRIETQQMRNDYQRARAFVCFVTILDLRSRVARCHYTTYRSVYQNYRSYVVALDTCSQFYEAAIVANC